jgi:probable phosphoglycerate mutase
MVINNDSLDGEGNRGDDFGCFGMPISHFDTRLRENSRDQIEGTIEQEHVEKWGADWKLLELGEESLGSVRERGM